MGAGVNIYSKRVSKPIFKLIHIHPRRLLKTKNKKGEFVTVALSFVIAVIPSSSDRLFPFLEVLAWVQGWVNYKEDGAGPYFFLLFLKLFCSLSLQNFNRGNKYYSHITDNVTKVRYSKGLTQVYTARQFGRGFTNLFFNSFQVYKTMQ